VDQVIVTAVVGAFAALGTHVLTLEATRAKLRRELEVELDKDRRARRAAAYTELWKRLEPLSIYAPPHQVDGGTLRQLSTSLREWYYQIGGMYLTADARAYYFALQDRLQQCGDEVLRPADRRFKQGAAPRDFIRVDAALDDRDQAFLALFRCGSDLRSQVAADLKTRSGLLDDSVD
jgi:hypothetical protein